MNSSLFTFYITVSDQTVLMNYSWSDPNERFTETGRLRLGDALNEKAFLLHLDLRRQFRDLDSSKLLVDKLGILLGDILLDNKLRGYFFEAIDIIRNDVPQSIVRVSVNFTDDTPNRIASLPWELSVIKRPEGDFGGSVRFATESNFIFSRGKSNPKLAQLTLHHDEKLRLLIVVAQPTYDPVEVQDFPSIDYEGIVEWVRVFADHNKHLVEVRILEDGNPENTSYEYCRKNVVDFRPHIVHFIGHGRLENSGGKIALSDNLKTVYRSVAWQGEIEFSEIFKDALPHLIFLQSCETAAIGEVHDHRGVAGQLMQLGVPVIIAMQYEIQKTTASRFAEHFYSSLFDDRQPIDYAVQIARNKLLEHLLSTEGINGSDEGGYATPVVFSQIGNTHIFPEMTQGRNGIDVNEVSEELLCNALWKLNYESQATEFSRAAGQIRRNQRTAAFLISGRPLTGHLWILNRLMLQHSLWQRPSIVPISVKLNGVTSPHDPWVGIASYVLNDLSKQPEINDDFKDRVADQIVTHWQDGSVLLLLDYADSVTSSVLQLIVTDIWERIIACAQERVSSNPNAWLIMFLIDRNNKFTETLEPFENYSLDWQVRSPLALSSLDEVFDVNLLRGWLQDLAGNPEYDLLLKILHYQEHSDREIAEYLMSFGVQPEKVLNKLYSAVYKDISELNDGHIRRLLIR